MTIQSLYRTRVLIEEILMNHGKMIHIVCNARFFQHFSFYSILCSFHTYYTSFHINAQWPVYEISDVLAAAMMSEEEYAEIEEKILKEVGTDGRFSGDVAESLGMTSTMLKSLVRRSVRMDFRGHRIELKRDE